MQRIFNIGYNQSIVKNSRGYIKCTIESKMLETNSSLVLPILKVDTKQNKSPQHPFINIKSNGSSRIVELDRLDKLNSLNLDMVQTLKKTILNFEDVDSCYSVILKSASFIEEEKKKPPKAFSAGGDVLALLKAKLANDWKYLHTFFSTEYSLNHLLAFTKKPIISILDGITMGGGAGISIHGAFRIATENTVFAMPEVGIGFFPDVGASFFLSRLDNHLGYYLGLTGHRLSGQDNYHAGIATHYIPSHRLDGSDGILDRLKNINSSNTNWNAILEEYSGTYQSFTLDKYLPWIERCFSKENIQDIFIQLENLESNTEVNIDIRQWAERTLAIMKTASPTSLTITLEMFNRAKKKTLRQCLEMEYFIALEFMRNADFEIGVSSKLISKSKDTPSWKPSNIDQVNKEAIKAYFSISPDNEHPISFAIEKDGMHYPHYHNSLPTLESVKLDGILTSKHNITENAKLLITKKYGSKIGIEERLRDIEKRINIIHT